VRHYSPKTLQTYRGWVQHFQTFLRSKAPEALSAEDVKEFLTSLAVKRKVSSTTQNQAFNAGAFLFFYRHVLKREFGKMDGVVRVDCSPLSQFQSHATTQGTWETSRGKTQSLLRVDAGFIEHAPLADGGLPGHVPTRPERTTPPIRFLFVAPRFRIGLPSDPASRRRPCPSPCLRLGENLAWGLSSHKSCAMPGIHVEVSGGWKPSAGARGYGDSGLVSRIFIFLCDLPFPQEHPQHFVLKDLFQGLRLQCLGHFERSASIETAVGAEHVAMGVEVHEIAEGLDRNDCPGSSLLFWREAKEKYLQGIPGTAAQLGEKFSIIK